MITITVTNQDQFRLAEAILSYEVRWNPDLNGASYRIEMGDHAEIDGCDDPEAMQLFNSIFCNESY